MLSKAHMACELCMLASLCVHCWWADVYADEKSFGNVASSALDEMRLAWLSQPSAHGSCGPHDAADKSVSALNATAVWMRECMMNGHPPRSWFSPWRSHHSSWLIFCAALLRKSQVALIQWHGICQESTAHTSTVISLMGLCVLLDTQKPLRVRHCISKTALYWQIQKCWLANLVTIVPLFFALWRRSNDIPAKRSSKNLRVVHC